MCVCAAYVCVFACVSVCVCMKPSSGAKSRNKTYNVRQSLHSVCIGALVRADTFYSQPCDRERNRFFSHCEHDYHFSFDGIILASKKSTENEWHSISLNHTRSHNQSLWTAWEKQRSQTVFLFSGIAFIHISHQSVTWGFNFIVLKSFSICKWTWTYSTPICENVYCRLKHYHTIFTESLNVLCFLFILVTGFGHTVEYSHCRSYETYETYMSVNKGIRS